MSGFLGALADAWAEIRVHKLRVLLSLVGIAVSVGALTAVVAFSEYQKQYQTEQSDRWGGREATITVSVMTEDGTPINADAFNDRFDRVTERFGFTHVSRVSQGAMMNVGLPQGITSVNTRLVDPPYSQMHRERLQEGRAFLPSDAYALAPPVIISEPLWDQLGRPPLSDHPTFQLYGEGAGTYQVIGVKQSQGMWDTELTMDLLFSLFRERVDSLPAGMEPIYEVWVGKDQVAEIGPVLAMDLRAGLPAGQVVSVNRSDWGAQQGAADALESFALITSGIAVLILALGALSLINIQLVAMRQRVREIGVRRAFGATSARVFTSVLLESLVATTVAGIVGIAVAVAILRSEAVITSMFEGLQDVPPFPMNAAIVGLVASVIVGAVSGFIPAIVALRVKVIDAIRF